jgi:hypothetical protein
MTDISVTGMGLAIESKAAKALGSPESLLLSFELPGCGMLRIPGCISYRKAAANVYRYGIEFKWPKPGGFSKEEAALAQFIASSKDKSLSPSREDLAGCFWCPL